ncbi:unnamed protein product [Amoebophrya sp. A25]|nr:unnamed protein product [Amoebophrya sp. A25]|eukprot:GSA25T00012295001.1
MTTMSSSSTSVRDHPPTRVLPPATTAAKMAGTGSPPLVPRNMVSIARTLQEHVGEMSKVRLYEEDIRRMILDYFVLHGCQRAAEAFRAEAFGPSVSSSGSAPGGGGAAQLHDLPVDAPLQRGLHLQEPGDSFPPRLGEEEEEEDPEIRRIRPLFSSSAPSAKVRRLDGTCGEVVEDAPAGGLVGNENEATMNLLLQGPTMAGASSSSSSSNFVPPATGISGGAAASSPATSSNPVAGGGSPATDFQANPSAPSTVLPISKVRLRGSVSSAIRTGKIEEGIRLLNELTPELLTQRPEVHFALLRWQLVQKIQAGEIGEALEYAQERLTPFVEQHPSLLPELEEVMGLIALPPGPLLEDSIKNLQGGSLQSVAEELDAVILHSFGMGRVSQLEYICKNVLWSQTQMLLSQTTRPHQPGHLQQEEDLLRPILDPNSLDAPCFVMTRPAAGSNANGKEKSS